MIGVTTTTGDVKMGIVRCEVAPVCGQLGGLFKVYSGCRSSCQNLLGSIFLSPLLRLWVSGQAA